MYIKKPYIILGIGVGVGVFSCAIHLLHRKNKEEILKTTCNRITRTIKIPKGFVGHVLGRGGSTIKNIREKTKARINFADEGSDFTVATITGTPEEVEDAVNEINQILTSRPATISKEITITENMSDSVFKNVNVIRQICDMTRAKITFDFMPAKVKDQAPMKVIVRGKKEEVEAAFDLIDELVAEVQLNQNKPVHVAGRALPNNLPLHSFSAKNKDLPSEKLIPSNPDGFIEVYVSAVDNPNKFWVQISGSKSIQLDKLATEMTDFYDDEKNKAKLQLNSISVGDIVAAYFQGDSSWYRAQVVKVSEQDSEKKISVFYLDFGDCAILNSDSISVLKPEFLSIPFQAIECSLADVEPLNDEWTEEASEEFEKMVYLGRWKVIMAKPIKQILNNGEVTLNEFVQLVELLDTNSDKDISISAELVSKGFAKFISNGMISH